MRARSEGHGRAARLLHARGAAPEEVASQLALTAPRGDAWVVEALRAAAARALSLGDPVAAAAHLTRALAEPPADRAAILADLAQAEWQSGAPAAVEHFREAMRLAASATERGRVALGLARCLKFRGDSPEAIDVLRAAIADVDDPALDEELEVELVVLGLHLARRAAAADAPRSPRSPRPRSRGPALDRLHLTASAFEGVIAARPAERLGGARAARGRRRRRCRRTSPPAGTSSSPPRRR